MSQTVRAGICPGSANKILYKTGHIVRKEYSIGKVDIYDSLFIVKRSTLKRASQWSLKQMIMSSNSQDISNLVSSNLVITN